MDMPTDPFTSSPMAESATATHEVYLGYLHAGFTDMQALYLTGIHLSTIGRWQLERNADAEVLEAERRWGGDGDHA